MNKNINDILYYICENPEGNFSVEKCNVVCVKNIYTLCKEVVDKYNLDNNIGLHFVGKIEWYRYSGYKNTNDCFGFMQLNEEDFRDAVFVNQEVDVDDLESGYELFSHYVCIGEDVFETEDEAQKELQEFLNERKTNGI